MSKPAGLDRGCTPLDRCTYTALCSTYRKRRTHRVSRPHQWPPVSERSVVHMTTTASDLRAQVVEFAATYPTANVRLAVQYAESGRLSWEQVADLFKRSLGTAI